jgi:hypothetical protein
MQLTHLTANYHFAIYTVTEPLKPLWHKSAENWINLGLYVTACPKRLLPVIMKAYHYQKRNLKQTSNFKSRIFPSFSMSAID